MNPNTHFLIKQRYLYWLPNSYGYTDKVSLAGIYLRDKAHNIVNNKREPPDVMVDMVSDDIIHWIKQEIEEAEKIVKMGKEKLQLLGIE